MEEKPDVDELVAQLRARVEQRRQQGVYPPGLEDDLDQHFRRIAAHRVIPDFTAVEQALAAMQAKAAFSADRIPASSGLPGGRVLHRVLAKLLRRQTDGILAQVQEYADAVQAATTAMLAAMQQPPNHTHGELVGEIDAILDRMAQAETQRP
jgi:hypothetical protein